MHVLPESEISGLDILHASKQLEVVSWFHTKNNSAHDSQVIHHHSNALETITSTNVQQSSDIQSGIYI